ncbi:ABC transporter substrate-binding protein [Aquamicrobium sp. LC103]|uniref:ABC transporter substrate-binding protein n=1 Tax=Aquamicrobium sp. LC103 TaxID=1120658 RepID=UPI00063EBF91|nr:ABC transporter substrate-binding protein [Aquamicrobium sp. LC103]TKT78313.1 ABC transporter substrate-binding protein [Aquamicrobium sp. LC103]
MNRKDNAMSRISAYLLATVAFCQPAFAQEQIRLGLDWGYLPYHAPLVIGQEKGYFKDEGIDLVMEPGRGSGTTAIMLGEGNYDIAHINTTNAAVAISKGVPIEVAAVYQIKTAASFIGLADKVNLADVEALKGYRIGSTPGGSDQLSLRIFRAVNDLSEFDLNVISLDANAKQAALLSGSIDVISGDGFAYGAIVRGTGQEPEIFALADYGVPLLGFGYSVNTDFAKRHPELVKGFLRAVKKSWQDAASDVPAACELAREKLQLTHKQEACVDYFNGLLAISADSQSPDWGQQSEQMWVDLLKTLAEVGEIGGSYEVTDFYTNEFVPAE